MKKKLQILVWPDGVVVLTEFNVAGSNPMLIYIQKIKKVVILISSNKYI